MSIKPGTVFPLAWDLAFIRFQQPLFSVVRWMGNRIVRPGIQAAWRWALPAILIVGVCLQTGKHVARWFHHPGWMNAEWSSEVPLASAVIPGLVLLALGHGIVNGYRRLGSPWKTLGWLLLYMPVVPRVGAALFMLERPAALNQLRSAGLPVSRADYAGLERSENNLLESYDVWVKRWYGRAGTGSPDSRDLRSVFLDVDAAEPGPNDARCTHALDEFCRKHSEFLASAERDLGRLIRKGGVLIPQGYSQESRNPGGTMGGSLRRMWLPGHAFAVIAAENAIHGRSVGAWTSVSEGLRWAGLLGSSKGMWGIVDGHFAIDNARESALVIMRRSSSPSIPQAVVRDIAALLGELSSRSFFEDELIESLDIRRAFRAGALGVYFHEDRHPWLTLLVTSWTGDFDRDDVSSVVYFWPIVSLKVATLESGVGVLPALPRPLQSLLAWELVSKTQLKMLFAASVLLEAKRRDGRFPFHLPVVRHPGWPAGAGLDPFSGRPFGYRVAKNGMTCSVTSVGPEGDGTDGRGKPLALALR